MRVEVTDRAGGGVPVLRSPGEEAESSRGLRLVDDLAARWGYERAAAPATTYKEDGRNGQATAGHSRPADPLIE